MQKFTFLTLALTISGLTGSALAQGNNPFIIADEYGVGRLITAGGSVFNMPGVMAVDPGPGGLPSALTYNLLGPPGLVAGDLFINDLNGGVLDLSEMIRFNPDGTAPGYQASIVFYSDMQEGADSLADTGFPLSGYANSFTMLEVDEQVFYTPTEGQPGFVPGFSVTYNFLSDTHTPELASAPEPASLSLLVIALGVLVGRHMYKVRTHRV